MDKKTEKKEVDRYERQRDLISQRILSNTAAAVIGTGAVGRQVALSLAAMGVGRLALIDFDTVNEVNLPAQGFFEADVGKKKVEAVAAVCRALSKEMRIDTYAARYQSAIAVPDVVFCCVDDISAREFIYAIVRAKTRFFVDTRMGAEVARILTVYDDTSRDYYPTTIFSSEDAEEVSCTAKTTLYGSYITAGLAVGEMAAYLSDRSIGAYDYIFNILTKQMFILKKK